MNRESRTAAPLSWTVRVPDPPRAGHARWQPCCVLPGSMRPIAAAFLLVLAVASSTHAAGLDLTFASAVWPACRDDDAPAAQDAGQPLHAAAVQHSDAYQTRAKIHKVASYATLPLFGAELLLGESLYNTPVSGAT